MNVITEQIKAVFPLSPIPEPEDLILDRSIEALYVKTFFAGKPWTEITLEVMQAEYQQDSAACLFFMSDVAVAYYVPAFLCMCIEDYYGCDMIFEMSMSILTNKNCSPFPFANYSVEQKSLVKRCLEYLCELERIDGGVEAEDALNSYWGLW